MTNITKVKWLHSKCETIGERVVWGSSLDKAIKQTMAIQHGKEIANVNLRSARFHDPGNIPLDTIGEP